jgi:hypothetical protein
VSERFLYHATYLRHLESIRRDGILPGSQTGLVNWGKVRDKSSCADEYVFAFQSEDDAVSWALMMQKASGGHPVCVLQLLMSNSERWEKDKAVAHNGHTGCKLRGNVPAKRIRFFYVVGKK